MNILKIIFSRLEYSFRYEDSIFRQDCLFLKLLDHWLQHAFSQLISFLKKTELLNHPEPYVNFLLRKKYWLTVFDTVIKFHNIGLCILLWPFNNALVWNLWVGDNLFWIRKLLLDKLMIIWVPGNGQRMGQISHEPVE